MSQVVCHYGNQWSVFSASDRYQEQRLYWSHDRSRADRFARAHSEWVRNGCPSDGSRPLTLRDDGSVYRQRDFDKEA